STSSDGLYCGIELYSGQSEVGFDVLRLTPPMSRILQLEYVAGDSDLSGVAFSPDGRLAALAVRPTVQWWIDPDDLDGDDETPSPGGEFDWGQIYVANLENGGVAIRVVSTSVPKGWVPDERTIEESIPSGLEFVSNDRVRMTVPWAGPVELDLKQTGKFRVPGVT